MQYTCDQLFTLTHSGQQVAATLTDKQHASEIWFTGSGLGGRFHFINFHLHWGENNRHGSEHEIDGHRFPAEAHFVHRNHENGQVAVLACFFTAVDEEQSTQNPWKQFTQVASRLTETHQIDHCTFNLSQLMSIQDRPFYRYHGSLTTPPCTEGVLWTVFAHEIPIEEDSLDLLRHNLLRKVYRPVQPLNGRTVFRNYNSSTTIWRLFLWCWLSCWSGKPFFLQQSMTWTTVGDVSEVDKIKISRHCKFPLSYRHWELLIMPLQSVIESSARICLTWIISATR